MQSTVNSTGDSTTWFSQYFDRIADALADQGWILLPNALPELLTGQLAAHVRQLEHSQFQQAGTGRQQQYNVDQEVRSDRIHWLDEQHPTEQQWLQQMEALRQSLNRQLYLGLDYYESHYAHYAPGAFYQKHLDAFKGRSNRRLSTVFYLNETWQEQDGGQLRLYHPESPQQLLSEVQPTLGHMLIFLSDAFPHEVLPAKRERFSIAGWFRTRA